MANTLAFGQEERQAARARELNQQYVASQMKMAHIGELQEALGSFFMNATALVMVIPHVRSGELSGVFLALLVLGTLASFEAVLPLPSAFQQMGSSLAAARRLFALVDAEPAVRDPAQPASMPARCDLAIDYLRFRYDGDEPYVLDGVSFTLPQGQCSALIGPSGAGKSTIANLLLRFWEYDEGHLLLGDHEVRDLPQDEVRKLFSMVTQDTHLFNTTIRQNLLIARQDVSEEEMIQAARQAHIHDFIMSLPCSYDTEIGEQGLCLSGGERQRLAIASAILKNVPILILDELTAYLDMADNILVLDNGHIVEHGPHDMLMQLEGRYWRTMQRGVGEIVHNVTRL